MQKEIRSLSDPSSVQHSDASPLRGFLPALLILFIGSGCAALIYEIVWFQLLQLVIGSSAISLGLLLGTFMGGMCLGSLMLSRALGTGHHPLRVYALLEFGIAVLGLAVLVVVPHFTNLYVLFEGRGIVSLGFRGLICAVCLLPPTILMGATLPAIARWIETTPRGISWLGLFYGGNIAGAVFGCLLAGFYLLRLYDMVVATLVAAAINVAVALCALALSRLAPYEHVALAPAGDLRRNAGAWAVYLAIGLSGASALGAEVVWTRLLALMLGPTVYTFSIILAIFLVGLGVGSSLGSVWTRTSPRPRLALGFCQLALTAAVAWTAFTIARSLPYWPINPDLSHSPWFVFQLDLLRVLWAVLPATCLWGASFPLALAAVATPGQDPGHLVGRVYAANTIGAIVGALGFGLPLVAWIGTQQSQRLLVILPALAAIVMFASLLGPMAVTRASRRNRSIVARLGGLGLIATTVTLAAWLVSSLPGIPWELVAFGRTVPLRYLSWHRDGQLHDSERELIYRGEGVNATVAVTSLPGGGSRHFHVAGKVEASSDHADMRLQRMLGHIPALVHPKPRSVLIVGCGAGVTAGSFVVHPDIERIVICEIEPLIPREIAPRFAEENYDVVNDSRVEIVIDDARHFILTTQEKFDIITSDPIHPWVKGAATLYTKEYFEVVKAHLKPGGVVTQWVPLYESTIPVVKSEIATFFTVFPHGTLWSNDITGIGYDTVLLGHADEASPTINVDQLEARLDREDHQDVSASLAAVGFVSGLELLTTYAGRANDLQPWMADAVINRDRNLRLQYLAGLELNTHQDNQILTDILRFCHYPDDLFTGSEARTLELQSSIDATR